MKCPHCEVVLVISERQGIEIDYCPQCRGVWLDRGELDKILERAEQSFGKPYTSNDKSERTEKDPPGERYDMPNRGQRYDTPNMRDRYDNDDDDRHRYEKGYPHRKKRGGFLGDLFDFD